MLMISNIRGKKPSKIAL